MTGRRKRAKVDNGPPPQRPREDEEEAASQREIGVDELQEQDEPESETLSTGNIDAEIAAAEAEINLIQKQQKLRELHQTIQYLRSDNVERSSQGDSTPNQRIIDDDAQSLRTVSAFEPSASRRSLRPEKLPIYKGKSVREHNDWCESAETAFELTPENFPTDKDKILYAMQFLGDDPRATWREHKRAISLDDISWEYFTNHLLNLVEDPVNRQLNAVQAFYDAQQRSSQSAASFHTYLSHLEAQLPEPFTEVHRKLAFFAKLRPDLRSALTNYQNLPETRDGMVALAARLESNVQRTPSGSNSQGRKRSRQEAASRGSERHDGAAQQPRRLDERVEPRARPRRPLSEVECYKCGKKGHIAPYCPNTSETAGRAAVATITDSGEKPDSGKAEAPPSKPPRQRRANKK